VIGGQCDDCAEFDKARHPRVERLVKRVRFRVARRVRVLDKIGQRQIEEPRGVAFEQPQPGVEHEQREIG